MTPDCPPFDHRLDRYGAVLDCMGALLTPPARPITAQAIDDMKTKYQALVAAGKPPKVAITAVMPPSSA